MNGITTIEEGKNFLKENVEKGKGVKCPCCQQSVKMYKRQITANVARDLMRLVRESDGEWWLHRKTFMVLSGAGGDFAKLRFWGLVEEKTNEETGKRTSGLWKPTVKGMDFINNRIRVPKYAYLYNQKFRGYGDETVNIIEVFGTRFDYSTLMNVKPLVANGYK